MKTYNFSPQDAMKKADPMPGVALGLMTPVARAVHDKDVQNRLRAHLDMIGQFAGGRAPIAPADPSVAHEYMLVGKILVHLMPASPSTTVAFHFVSGDGILCVYVADLETSDVEAVRKEIETYLLTQRQLMGAKAWVAH